MMYLILFVLIFISKHMAISNMYAEKDGKIYRYCAYLFLLFWTVTAYFVCCKFLTEFIIKTIYFDPSVVDTEFYIQTYRVQYILIVSIMMIIGFVLFSKKAIDLAKKSAYVMRYMEMYNFGLTAIAYFIIETASIIILPDSVTHNVRTMHILKGTVFIPLTILAFVFIFRYTNKKAKETLIQIEDFKKTVEENLQKRN